VGALIDVGQEAVGDHVVVTPALYEHPVDGVDSDDEDAPDSVTYVASSVVDDEAVLQVRDRSASRPSRGPCLATRSR
jgi:hypothetical protein